ncbi:MAG: hypothetical protein IPO42_10690 [Chitinophagaceae bacterium]|nr:hypothetical protein [Chitinophagaceae bacterium]
MMKAWPKGALSYIHLRQFTNKDFANRKLAPDVVYTGIDDVHKLVLTAWCMARQHV